MKQAIFIILSMIDFRTPRGEEYRFINSIWVDKTPKDTMFPVGQSGPGPVGPPALNQVREALDLNFISKESYLLHLKVCIENF